MIKAVCFDWSLMTETQLFVSSCSRRELAKRRSHSWYGAALARLQHPALTVLACAVVCAGAFLAGHGGF